MDATTKERKRLLARRLERLVRQLTEAQEEMKLALQLSDYREKPGLSLAQESLTRAQERVDTLLQEVSAL